MLFNILSIEYQMMTPPSKIYESVNCYDKPNPFTVQALKMVKKKK